MKLSASEQCDLTRRTCAIDFPQLRVEVIFLKSPEYLVPFEAEVALHGEVATKVTKVTLQFVMNGMQMRLPEAALIKGTTSELATSRWRNTVMIPVCTSGRNDWIVEVQATTAEKKYVADFPLRMTPKQ